MIKPFRRFIAEQSEPSVSFSIPLFIRLLEYAKEDAKTDMDLHRVAEKAIDIGNDGAKTMDMKDYENLVS